MVEQGEATVVTPRAKAGAQGEPDGALLQMSPASPSAILERRQSQIDCNVRPPPLVKPVASNCLGDSTPTPSPTLLLRRQRNSRLTLNCSLIRGEARWTPSVAPQDEVSQISKDYDIQEILGQGSTGVVRRACRRCDGQEVCLKVVRTSDPELAEVARAEMELLKSLQHPHIVKGHGCVSSPSNIILILELFDGPTLHEAVRQAPGRRFCEDKARDLFRCLVSAVAYLHANGIVHRDVKAENVLVAHDLGDLRLIDFNTAQRVAEGGALTMTGTRDWAAPEVLRGQSPGLPHDVWGAGLCLFLMLAGRLPLQARHHKDEEDYVLDLLHGVASFGGNEKFAHLSDNCKETVQACLEELPASRREAKAVLEGAWLR